MKKNKNFDYDRGDQLLINALYELGTSNGLKLWTKTKKVFCNRVFVSVKDIDTDTIIFAGKFKRHKNGFFNISVNDLKTIMRHIAQYKNESINKESN